eukprot:scaffold298640_cov31-Tisochrysis_lutea.AAC.1
MTRVVPRVRVAELSSRENCARKHEGYDRYGLVMKQAVPKVRVADLSSRETCAKDKRALREFFVTAWVVPRLSLAGVSSREKCVRAYACTQVFLCAL